MTVYPNVINFSLMDPQVSYRLVGFDEKPITLSRSELMPVVYTNLRGGEYRFTMKLEDGTGSGSPELSVTIRKEPLFYEQPLFWMITAIFVLLLNLWLIQIILRRQARRIEKRKDEERIAEELRMAKELQRSALPMVFPAFPERTEFDLYASMTPAKEVGGDFYDFFLIDSDHLGLVIADVSGKGIPAALFMMVSKTLIKNQLLTGCTPAAALERVNLQLCERNETKMFVTVWTAVLEISSGKGLACNAGHEHPALQRAGGGFELLKYKHGMFAGVSKKAKYVNREFELHPGDCVFVYTDGVPETINPSEEMFGEERLLDALNRDPELPPDETIRRVHDAVDQFAGGMEQFDDITMLCLKYNGVSSTDQIILSLDRTLSVFPAKYVSCFVIGLGHTQRLPCGRCLA